MLFSASVEGFGLLFQGWPSCCALFSFVGAVIGLFLQIRGPFCGCPLASLAGIQ